MPARSNPAPYGKTKDSNDGQFYTPSFVAGLLMRLGGQSKRRNAQTRRLAVMSLAIRGMEADFGEEQADTFRRDLHPDLRADFVIANPPFTDSDIAMRDSAFFQCEALPQVMTTRNDNFRKDDDVRRKYGVPPKGNANFGWLQHFIHHLAPTGMAGFVLANGSMSSNLSGDCAARSALNKLKANQQSLPRQRGIRNALIEADLVDCMAAHPGQLFYSTRIQCGKMSAALDEKLPPMSWQTVNTDGNAA